MGYKTHITTQKCFYNQWNLGLGVYWSLNGSRAGRYGNIVMSRTGGNCPASGKTKRFYLNQPATIDEFTVNVYYAGDSNVQIEIWKTSDLEPAMTKPQIISNHSDKLGYIVGDIIKSECVIKNIGASGIVYLSVGLGYIDSSNMIFLTGMPTTDQLYLKFGQSYTFKEDVKVDITDYYRQQGIGWAYLQQQMYLFFLVGHKVSGDIIWDTERHIKVYLEPNGDFTDPTSLDESVVGDIPEIIEDALPAFGGLGGLGGVLDEIKPDAKDVVDWIVDKVTPEPKEPEEQPDLMPFIYIGFAGLVGYLLIRSQ